MKNRKTHTTGAAESFIGAGGELHLTASESHPAMTDNQGAVVGDDENSLKVGERGPVLLEDFTLLEKINHFDHERIPERAFTRAEPRPTVISN